MLDEQITKLFKNLMLLILLVSFCAQSTKQMTADGRNRHKVSHLVLWKQKTRLWATNG